MLPNVNDKWASKVDEDREMTEAAGGCLKVVRIMSTSGSFSSGMLSPYLLISIFRFVGSFIAWHPRSCISIGSSN